MWENYPENSIEVFPNGLDVSPILFMLQVTGVPFRRYETSEYSETCDPHYSCDQTWMWISNFRKKFVNGYKCELNYLCNQSQGYLLVPHETTERVRTVTYIVFVINHRNAFPPSRFLFRVKCISSWWVLNYFDFTLLFILSHKNCIVLPFLLIKLVFRKLDNSSKIF